MEKTIYKVGITLFTGEVSYYRPEGIIMQSWIFIGLIACLKTYGLHFES